MAMSMRPKITIPLIHKEATMLYKMIVLGLLEHNPEIHEQLRRKRQLLPTMERYAIELKILHDDWKADLWRMRPGSDEIQIASEALALAMENLQATLLHEFAREQNETPVLDGAIEFARRHTPPA